MTSGEILGRSAACAVERNDRGCVSLEFRCGHGVWARSLVVADSEQAPKMMRLRYAGRCRSCAVALTKGDRAVYDLTARKVLCLPCAGPTDPDSPAYLTGQAVRELASGSRPDVAAALPALPDRSARGSLVDGVAGASAAALPSCLIDRARLAPHERGSQLRLTNNRAFKTTCGIKPERDRRPGSVAGRPVPFRWPGPAAVLVLPRATPAGRR